MKSVPRFAKYAVVGMVCGSACACAALAVYLWVVGPVDPLNAHTGMESYFMSDFGWPGVAPRGAVAGAIVGVLVAFVVPDKRRRRRDPDEPYGYADME